MYLSKGFKIKSTNITFKNHLLIHCGKLPSHYYSNIEILKTYNIPVLF